MRHGKKHNHLGRTKSHRKAMLSNMANSLIKTKRINTTIAKAKALRIYIEPLVTKGKTDSTHNRRTVFSYLQDKESINELFGTISEKVATRNGGYTRIIKLGTRYGDNAEMALIEFVDFNDNLIELGGEEETTTKTRRRRGGKKKANSKNEGESTAEVVEETTSEVKTEETAEKSESSEEKA